LSEDEKDMDTFQLTKPTDGSSFGMKISADCDVTAFSCDTSVAKLGGVQVGSKIIRLNGTRVHTRKQVTEVLRRAEGGEVIEFLLCPKRSLHKLPSFRDVVSGNPDRDRDRDRDRERAQRAPSSPKPLSKPQTKANADAELAEDGAPPSTPTPPKVPLKERRLSLSVSQGLQQIVTGGGGAAMGTSPLSSLDGT
jgi:hypothetical protein